MNSVKKISKVCAFGLAVLLVACATKQTNLNNLADQLVGTTWQIEDIDSGGVIDNSMITMQFVDNNRIAGSSGCNRYFGTIAFVGDKVELSAVGSTRRACVPAINNQEMRFLSALQSTVKLQTEGQHWLLALDDTGKRRLKMIRIESAPTVEDAAGSDFKKINYLCDGSNRFTVFYGEYRQSDMRVKLQHDEIWLSDAQTHMAHLMKRQHSASGEKYSDDSIEFWTQGQEAMLSQNGTPMYQNCSITKN